MSIKELHCKEAKKRILSSNLTRSHRLTNWATDGPT